MLFSVIEVASARGVAAELLLPAHKRLRDSPTQAQLHATLADILACDEMEGFRFPPGSEADDVMRALEPVPDEFQGA